MKIIAAVSLDGAIGHDDKLLWHISEDFKRYKQRTTNNVCIVGLNTYNGLPRKALEGRIHIVISPDGDLINTYEDTWIVSSLKEAIEMAKTYDKEIFIIGGSQLFESMIDYCDGAEITWINNMYIDANKRFPIDKLFKDFEIVGDSSWVKSESGLNYKFTDYKRVKCDVK